METTNVCSICGTEAESEFHALIICPHAAALRWAMRDHWALPGEELLRPDGEDWLLLLISSLEQEKASRMALLLWRTWHTRNEIVHNSKMNSIASSVGFLKAMTNYCLRPENKTWMSPARRRSSRRNGRGKKEMMGHNDDRHLRQVG